MQAISSTANRLRLVAAVVALVAAAMSFAGPADAKVRYPDGKEMMSDVACNPGSTTGSINVSYDGPGEGWYRIWAYRYDTGAFTLLTEWTRENVYGVSLPSLQGYGWVAFYAQYAHFYNGAWDVDEGEWMPASRYQTPIGYWCQFQRRRSRAGRADLPALPTLARLSSSSRPA